MVRFDDDCVMDYQLRQRDRDGGAEWTLRGDFMSDQPGVPYLKAVCETDGQVMFAQALPAAAHWRHKVRLPAGVYRLESGALLDAAGRNPQYLGRGQMRYHVAVGEVFIIAGQSNAAGYGVHNMADPLDMPAVGVHRFADGAWELAAHPIGQLSAGPAADQFNCGHSPWLYLGNLLREEGVPAGLVPAAKNGSSMEDWEPDGALYRNLVELTRAAGAANLIWMQGCSDVHKGYFEVYGSRLERFFTRLIADTGIGRVILIQISGKKKNESLLGWKTVREHQRQIARRFGFTLIPTYDLGDYADEIHLSNRANLLLARRVLDALHGKSGPELIRAQRIENGARLIFSAPPCDGTQAVMLDGNLRRLPCRNIPNGAELELTHEGTEPARFVTLNVGVWPLPMPLQNPTADFFIDLDRLPEADFQ